MGVETGKSSKFFGTLYTPALTTKSNMQPPTTTGPCCMDFLAGGAAVVEQLLRRVERFVATSAPILALFSTGWEDYESNFVELPNHKLLYHFTKIINSFLMAGELNK